MNFLIVTNVEHFINEEKQVGGYSPYVREMNLWSKYVDQLTILAPFKKGSFTNFDIAYTHHNIKTEHVPEISFLSVGQILRSLVLMPGILWKIFWQMKKADHIHLRCPNNMGLLGCLVQVLFPRKTKTAKYASNWDPDNIEPLSYSMQKAILNHTFFTRNMTVLVYGAWPNMTKNSKPFFTATYFSNELEPSFKKSFAGDPVFVFSGVMSERKDPWFTYELFKEIRKKLPGATLHFCGDGELTEPVKDKAQQERLSSSIIFEGALSKAQLKEVYKRAHFLLFFTKTNEGWPKAVAESLFWGVIPVTKPISVVSQMLDNGNRGLLFTEVEIPKVVDAIVSLWNDKERIAAMSQRAMDWSQQYTLDRFENEIAKLIR
jgi:glycosyltransferase involved in cell wall biosynthesis